MSNFLAKPYEISLWKDDPNGSEVKICTIGSNTMEGQNRAFEPIFSKNVNGVKKFSFKIYKKYVDTQTGAEVDNPYFPYLISERKVKLYLPEEPVENQWHDFIIKNVNENSSTYLCTYQLEDALVQELSKNGFNVILDAQLNNNIGTAKKLATEVLKDTDWSVSEEETEVFVQTIDEALVYVKLPAGQKAYKLLDQTNLTSGVQTASGTVSLGGKTVLAFYSSCTGRPHRFQFIYSADGYERDSERYITTKNCQYYIEFEDPGMQYNEVADSYGFYLPKNFQTTTVIEESGQSGTILSTKYRGKRYGFSQQSEYIPQLDKYVSLYDKDGTVYYGYENSEYKSPALNQNLISNFTFESTSGWTGTHNTSGSKKAEITSVYGYFYENAFVDSSEELKNGTFGGTIKVGGKDVEKPYKTYLKLVFPDANATVINSGPYDNRTSIGEMNVNDEWAARYVCYNTYGNLTNDLNIQLGEYVYSKDTESYQLLTTPDNKGNLITFNSGEDKEDYRVFTTTQSTYNKETFKKKMKVRVQLSPFKQGVYYLEQIELFKVAYYNNKIIPLEEQGTSLENRTVEKTYYYFPKSAVANISNEEQLKPESISKTLTYKTYTPLYNTGAEKIRSVTEKESNYFNILQSIAETFEAWLTFVITRNPATGAITKKEVAFKNYIAGENNACFRYGVNLKDIQRTYESKNIVTKLIVKNNSNEHAKDGFCTIQRANANPTGDNCIYDFQYFFNVGLMEPKGYLDVLYTMEGASGADVGGGQLNLNGYFPRVKALNKIIADKNEILANISLDLTKYKADLELAEAGYDAALSGIEETRDDFETLTQVPIDCIYDGFIQSVELNGKQTSEENAKKEFGYYYSTNSWVNSVTVFVNKVGETYNIAGTVTAKEADANKDRNLYIKVYPKVTLKNGTVLIPSYSIKCTIVQGTGTTTTGKVEVHSVDTSSSNISKKLQEYTIFRGNETRFGLDKEKAETNVSNTQAKYNDIKEYIDTQKGYKQALNEKFFSTYSRFIQEGTWIDEEYVDDEKYFADAQSVMYNSCYPQVAYSINVIELSRLPGYEDFTYKIGETTYVEDIEFFGEDYRERVIITEIVENLDDSSKNQIKVQNFKNQFQDLFQKITAAVQQAQYSTGSYEKAVALAEANQERKQQFLTDALDGASARLTTAGQQSVTWGSDGITVKSVNSPSDAIRMVGGAILLSKQDENGEQKWVTGVTSDGVSAGLITAGTLNAGEITIMNSDEPVFRWDEFGISAYDSTWYDSEIGTVTSGINTRKFVRFDKYGLYGIDNNGVDGANWHPTGAGYNGEPMKEIDNRATFSLTWEGLKVTGDQGGTARIGKQDGYIMLVHDNEGNGTFGITEAGKIEAKEIEITSGSIGGTAVNNLANKSYVNNQIGNIKIGGKNLLRNSDTKINEAFTSSTTAIIASYSITETLAHNSQVTLSFNAEFPQKKVSKLEVLNSSGNALVTFSPLSAGPANYSYTFYWSGSSDALKIRITVQSASVLSPAIALINWIKLEKGSKATDWTPAPEDTQEFIDKAIQDVSEQIDKKAEIFYQDTDPKPSDTSWNNDESIGNMWRNTSDNKEYVWKKNDDGSFSWHEMEIPNNIFDAYDGKATLYVSMPPSYKKNDLWILDEETQTTTDCPVDGTGIKYKIGTLLIASDDCPRENITQYQKSDWVEKVNYTEEIAKKMASDSGDTYNDFAWKVNDKGVQYWASSTTLTDDDKTGSFEADDKMLFKVGKENGVSGLWLRGHIEATSGKIGTMTIGDLNSKLVGRNLILGTEEQKTGLYLAGSYNLSQNNTYTDGDDYVISLDVTLEDASDSEINNKTKILPDGIMLYNSGTNSEVIISQPYPLVKGATTHVKFSFKWVNHDQDDNNTVLNIYVGRAYIDSPKYLKATISNAKLEKGVTATEWITAPEDNGMSDDVDNKYSWQFSPTKGIKMWKGPQTTDPIFKVDATGALFAGDLQVLRGDSEFKFNSQAIQDTDRVLFARKGDTYLFAAHLDGSLHTPYFKILNKEILDTSEQVGLVFQPEAEDETIYLTATLNPDSCTVWPIFRLNSLTGKQELTFSVSINTKYNNGIPNNAYLAKDWKVKVIGRNKLSGWQTVVTQKQDTKVKSQYSWGASVDAYSLSETGTLYSADIYIEQTYLMANGVETTSEMKLGSFSLDYDEAGSNQMFPIDLEYWTTYQSLDYKAYIRATPVLLNRGGLYPEASGIYSLGGSSKKWNDIWAVNGTIQTSDLNAKKDIEIISNEYDIFFDALQPFRYKFIQNQSDRYHIGFGSQHIKNALSDANLTTQDFAGYIEWNNKDGVTEYGLRYGEFIALNTWQIQKLKPRVSSLEQTILDYKIRISNLETEIQNLKS